MASEGQDDGTEPEEAAFVRLPVGEVLEGVDAEMVGDVHGGLLGVSRQFCMHSIIAQ